MPAAYFNILTPHKGTPLYDRMLGEGRIIDIDDIGRWPGIHCHIRPLQCSAEQLEERVRRLYYEFYSYPSMFTRLSLPLNQSRIASWVINLSQRRDLPRSLGKREFRRLLGWGFRAPARA